mmetsp:Transcript_9950/g.22323  ORF Transcript_9950/g.22323 Transcript_9950/m.22323 type:complete len:448 (+) Transcript_9950:69-1412(+)|eukprot:CAMPEP_0172316552 /NCGR_PEP_ID=MMETSP1058-20130122/28649_1 /TAXON_ID=83371 /ORGANISM="Detonula confervacea, Strain CCMP 353" /LENGTH=447 /DNA_ID=CAMNT_0013030887 /DNA_START=55 /DNA_END=1398 /DNA_ORIENTATION=-
MVAEEIEIDEEILMQGGVDVDGVWTQADDEPAIVQLPDAADGEESHVGSASSPGSKMNKRWVIATVASAAFVAMVVGLGAGLGTNKNTSSSAMSISNAIALEQCLKEEEKALLEFEKQSLLEKQPLLEKQSLLEGGDGIPTSIDVTEDGATENELDDFFPIHDDELDRYQSGGDRRVLRGDSEGSSALAKKFDEQKVASSKPRKLKECEAIIAANGAKSAKDKSDKGKSRKSCKSGKSESNSKSAKCTDAPTKVPTEAPTTKPPTNFPTTEAPTDLPSNVPSTPQPTVDCPSFANPPPSTLPALESGGPAARKGLCQGDCDPTGPSRCKSGLICYQRTSANKEDSIPGCSGTSKLNADYCVVEVPNNYLTVKGTSGQCTNNKPCKRCQGFCVNNNHCAGDLKCFKRGSDSAANGPKKAVPGCCGTGVPGKNYCYRDEDRRLVKGTAL